MVVVVVDIIGQISGTFDATIDGTIDILFAFDCVLRKLFIFYFIYFKFNNHCEIGQNRIAVCFARHCLYINSTCNQHATNLRRPNIIYFAFDCKWSNIKYFMN